MKGATDHYDLSIKPPSANVITAVKPDPEDEEESSNFEDVLIAVLVICVIACVVGFAWKRK